MGHSREDGAPLATKESHWWTRHQWHPTAAGRRNGEVVRSVPPHWTRQDDWAYNALDGASVDRVRRSIGFGRVG